jgi:hypothetical protein
MNPQHQSLAAGRWKEFSFLEQMANIGSEVGRALNWRAKNNNAFSQKALERSLELLDLTLENAGSYPRRRELARVREALVDFFWGSNEFHSTEALWKKYFLHFNFAARKND